MTSKQSLATATTTKINVKSALMQLESNFKGVDIRPMRFSEKPRDSKKTLHQSLSCQPKRGIEVSVYEEQSNELRLSASLDPAASRKSIGNGSILSKKLPSSCQNKTSSSQSIKGCFLSTKNSGNNATSSNKGSFFALSSEGISLKEQGKYSKNITNNSKICSNGNILGIKKIRSDRDTITRGNEVVPIKYDRQDSSIQGTTPKQASTQNNKTLGNKVKKQTRVFQNSNTTNTETSIKMKKIASNSSEKTDISAHKENLKDIEDPFVIKNSKQECKSYNTIRVSNNDKPIDNLIESAMESAVENSSQQQTTQMDSAYNGSYSYQQQQQQSVPSQLKGLMTPPASLSASATARGKQFQHPPNILTSSGHMKNECQVIMSESVGWKRPSEFSLVESTSQWSCAKCCIWSEEQDKRMRELKTKYHLRDALQRQQLNSLLTENKTYQEQITCLQKQIDHTAALRPLVNCLVCQGHCLFLCKFCIEYLCFDTQEIAHIRRLAQELAIEKNKYLQGLQFQQSYPQITAQMYDVSQPLFNYQQQEINTKNQILLLQNRIREQDEIILRLSSEINILQIAKDQLEEGLKNVLLTTQLQALKKNTQILNQDNINDQSIHDSQTISFEISQQKPSCLLSSEISNHKAFLCLGASLQDLPGSLPPSIYLSQNLPTKQSSKTKNNVIIDDPEKSKIISMTASPSSSQPRKNSTCSIQEGFIFGPPKNASICSMEELLRTQCQDNERVIFLGETEENVNSENQIDQKGNNQEYIQLSQKLTQSHRDQHSGEVINEQNAQYQQFIEKQQNEGQQLLYSEMIQEPQRLKANFSWDAQKQEFVINESQLAVLIANYQKTIAVKNNRINTLTLS